MEGSEAVDIFASLVVVYRDRAVRFVRFANNDSIYSGEILLGSGFHTVK